MRDELENKLVRDFPNLYKQYNDIPTETCMCWGFECDDGWFGLIYELSKKISIIDPNVQAVQVKEKYGGLRFYVGSVSMDTADEIFDLINEYENKSYEICEMCGTTEDVTTNEHGWVLTLCKKCREERLNNKDKFEKNAVDIFNEDPEKFFGIIEKNVSTWVNEKIKKINDEKIKKKWQSWWENQIKKGADKN